LFQTFGTGPEVVPLHDYIPHRRSAYAGRTADCARCATPWLDVTVMGEGCKYHVRAERIDKPVQGMTLAGGQEFRFPGAVVVSANITPDLETGIGSWSEQDFLDRFYQYKEYAEKGSPQVGPESF
jgi:hypothetical protein